MEIKKKTSEEIIKDVNSTLLEKMIVLFESQKSILFGLCNVVDSRKGLSLEETKMLLKILESLLKGDIQILRYLNSEMVKTLKIN